MLCLAQQTDDQPQDVSEYEVPGAFDSDIYYELGLTFGLVAGNADLSNTSFRPHIGPAISVGYRWDKLSLELAYFSTGLQYTSYVPRTDTIQPVYFSAADTTYELPTFFTADVEGEYSMRYLEGRFSYCLKEKSRMRMELAARVAYLLSGSNRGTALVDIGTFAGREDEFDNEADYLNSLYSRLPEDFDETEFMSKLDFGLMIKYRFLLYNNMKMFANFGFGFNPVQKDSDLVQINFYNIFMQTGINF